MAQLDPLDLEPRIGSETTRREFLQVLIGGSTLMIGGVFLTREQAAALPGPGNTSDQGDLGDSLVAVESDYKYDLTLEVTPHNRVRFELPRQDKGQGIATALAMMIAEEMNADYDRVDVALADRMSVRTTTITGGSSTIRTMWEPARTVAANARLRLVTAAANRWSTPTAPVLPTDLTVKKSLVIHEASGRAANFGELSAEAAALAVMNADGFPEAAPVPLKALADYTIIGTYQGRKNARAIVTGAQKYTMDIGLPGSSDLPVNPARAVILRPPARDAQNNPIGIKGRVASINNLAAVQAMPGVVPGGVFVIDLPERGPVDTTGTSFPQSTGVAVVADTFLHALVARDALDISWAPGPMANLSSEDIRQGLIAITPALTPVPPGVSSLEAAFDFPFVSHAPLEVMNATADVRATAATIWYPSQTPNYQTGQIATATGLSDTNITMHVPFGGGAFGRHLFGESAIEAAVISQKLFQDPSNTTSEPKPVKLMWTRADEISHGRFRPMTHHHIQATWLNGTFLSWEHQVAAVEMDLRHGYGDAFLGPGYSGGQPAVEQAAFGGTVWVPYEFGITQQRLTNPSPRYEVPTGSWRSIYSGFTMTANEIVVDELARTLGQDEIAFRLANLPTSSNTATEAARAAIRRCLTKVAQMAGLSGPNYPLGPNMGVAVHGEYRSAIAYLVEIDTTGAEPRLTKAYCAIDAGVPINKRGLEAQAQGALIDAWSVTMRASNHLDHGAILENSYHNFLWARMNHAPPTIEVYVFDATGTTPGGAGELGIPAGSAACVNAYARATGTHPRRFPISEFPPS